MNPSGIDANKSVAHRPSGALPLNYLQRYGLAVVSIGVALGISLLLQHFGFRVPSALLLLFAVAISSWYAGAGPAVLAAILSTISFYWYFVEPVHTIYIYRSQIPYFVIFTAFAALLSRFGTFRQRAEADLRRTHDQLEVERPRLGSRTIALLYFAFSSCWILFTDRLVHGLGLSNAYLLKVSEAKGILFISLSTLLMYVLVERALRQRHSVATAYWQLVETAQEGVWSVDAEGKTVFANENMAAILGTSPGEMIGKSILPFVPREKKDELLNHLLQREQGLQEHYEFPFLRADGAQVWTLLRVSPVLRDGQHSGCLALVSDITKRKHAEEALRRLNRELRAISNCNQALLRATDEQSLLEEICRIVCEEAGYRMAWVSYAEHDEAKSVRPVAWTGAEEGYLASAGITWADTDRGRSPTGTAIRSGKSCCIQDFATDPRLAPWREGLLQRGFRSGIALPLKDENDNAFGSLTIHSAQPNAFTSEEVRLLEELAGDLAFGIVTLRSRAARKRAEQALRQSEAYLAEAQRLSHTGSWALDVPSGNYVYSSEEYLRICGFDPQQGLPAKDQPLQQIHRDDFDKFWQAFQKLIDEKVDSEGEYRIVLPDGTVKYVHAIRHPVLNANGELVEIVGTTVDITERKRAEEALKRSEAYLAEAQRLTHTGSFAYDGRTNTFPYWSEEHFRIWGIDPRQGPPDGETLLQRVHPEDREMVRELSVKALRERRDYTAEYRIVLPDGTVKHIEAIGHLVSAERRGPIEVIGTHVDVTERKRAEQALRESETRFRTFVDHAGDALFVQDLEQGIIVDVNRQACESLGYTRQELIGSTAVAFHLDADRAEMESAAERAAAGETVVDTHRHRRKDGTVFPVEANTSSFWYGGRRFLLHVSRDISDRLRAEEEVRNTAAQWQATFDAVQDLVLLLDKDFRVLRANHAAAEFLGLPFDKIVGGHCYDLTHGTSTPPAECPLAKMRQSRRHEEAEILARKGGPWLSVSVDPLFDPSGELTQVVHVARDITERKRAEEALRRNEAYLAESQRLTHTGTFVGDNTTKPLYWSEELFRIFGFDPQQGLPTRDQPLQRIHPEDVDKVKKAFDRAIHGKADSDVEYRIVLPDGTVRILYGKGHPVLNANGEVVEVMGTTVDITERKLAEEALRESETRFRTFVDHAADALFVYDLKQRTVVDVNRSACESLGYTRQELIGNTAVAFHLDSYQAEMESVTERAAAGETVFDRHWHRRKDGSTFPVEVHTSLVSYGGRRFLLKVARDITDRLRAEEQLRQSEAYLAEAQRLSHTGSWGWNAATGEYDYWSEETLRIYGLDPQEGLATGKAALRRIHPEDRDRWKQNFEKSLREKVDTSDEYRIVLPDGKTKHIHTIRRPVLNDAGDLIRLVGTSIDITERKRVEEAMRRTEAYLAGAQRLTHTGSWVHDGRTREPLYWSEEVYRIIGFDPQKGLPTRDQAWERIHPEDRAKFKEASDKTFREKVDYDIEYRIVLPDGTVKHTHALGHPVLNPDGEIVEVVGANMDITERKRAEEERESLRADLAHMDRVSILGELTASIAHEVNQPLSGIVSSGSACLRWLARDVPDLEEAREAARRIVRDGKRAGEIIARIRALTKKAVASREKLNLNETIREVLALVGDEAKRNTVVIRTRFGDDVFPVLGDQVQLQQVVLNLVMNAIEAMSSVGDRARELVITTRNIDQDQVQVTVEDSGTGIDPQMIDKIFGSFYTTKPGGMGMGLSISRSILQAHGGRLWAIAKDGAGTVFHFTLPKYHEEESHAGVAAV